MSNTVYEIVTEKIIKALENGIVPWKQPWTGGINDRHHNGATGRVYRGVNPLLLSLAATEQGFKSAQWYSWKQVGAKGGEVLPEERKNYTIVVFWCFLDGQKKNEDDSFDETDLKHKKIPLLRYYRVYNLEQTTIQAEPSEEEPAIKKPKLKPLKICDDIVSGYPNPPKLRHGEARACYIPTLDLVNVPRMSSFKRPEFYYSTLFHELVHSTGAEGRLNRFKTDSAVNFSDSNYSKEELVAEIGSAFLCDYAGISPYTIVNSVAYIDSWLKALNDDKKMIIYAAARANKAADFILGEVPGKE